MSKGETTTHRVSFAVADVSPGTERLAEISVLASIERTVRSKVVSSASAGQKVADSSDFHPLIAAAALAYKKHYPLILSPDMIWLTVLQGVAQHIANNSALLRSRLVPHLTKIELVVSTNAFPETDAQMLSVTRDFAELVRKHALPDKRFLLDTEFSTTTDVERIAGAVVLMDAFQPYFDYVMNIVCGIPSVVLEGSPADWELLGDKVRSLHESDLELSWWTRHLLPLCEQFVRAARGDVDRNHWGNLCKLIARYGVDDLNGWLLKFIPYVRHEKNEIPQHRNPVLELTEFPTEGESFGKITGCTSNMLPSGLSSAPVTCRNLATGKAIQYDFVGGFTGVTQSETDFSMRPSIGWAITEGKRIDKLIARIRLEHEYEPSKQQSLRELMRQFHCYVPGDLWRFYTEFDGARINIRRNKWGEDRIRLISSKLVEVLWDRAEVQHELHFLSTQKLIDIELYKDRTDFNFNYSQLIQIAEAKAHGKTSYYVFGPDPEQLMLRTKETKQSRGEIFRWTGERSASAFTPVAHTFTDWLTELLDSRR